MHLLHFEFPFSIVALALYPAFFLFPRNIISTLHFFSQLFFASRSFHFSLPVDSAVSWYNLLCSCCLVFSLNVITFCNLTLLNPLAHRRHYLWPSDISLRDDRQKFIIKFATTPTRLLTHTEKLKSQVTLEHRLQRWVSRGCDVTLYIPWAIQHGSSPLSASSVW